MKRLLSISICFVLIFGIVVFFAGCNKKTPATGSTDSTTVENTVDTTTAMADDTTQQKICPVMKNPIDKEYYTEYKGKKVYFCCPSCEEVFAKDPEKYVKDLPQFN